jgi:phospholipid transport system substrate-binding protein
VIHTYASAFANYTNETVQFQPLRSGQLNQNYLTVNSTVNRPGGPSIPVSYSLSLANGKWLVTDFSVDGVSMVNSFRSQIASLDASKGLAGITAALKQHNTTIANQ